MELRKFIRQRQEHWQEFMRLLELVESGGLSTLEPGEVKDFGRLYRRLCADLAFAQTHFPNSRTCTNLNRLVGRAHSHFYRPRAAPLSGMADFFVGYFPDAFRQNYRSFIQAAALLLFGMFFGAVVTLEHAEFARMFMPPDVYRTFVERAWYRLGPGDLPGSVICTRLLTNNISVMLFAFAGGFLLGLGTAAILLINGAAIGAVAALCSQTGAGGFLMDRIAAHGPLEMSILTLAGAAGLSIGSSLIEPGDMHRRDALRSRGRQSVALVLGAAPFLALAALVEAFVSPSPYFRPLEKAVIGLLLCFVFFFYLMRAGHAEASRPARQPGTTFA